MNVFISWSGTGELSERAAELIRDWLPLVLQSVQPWMSAKDLYAGTRWSHELSKQLSESNFGILCVTRDSMNKPWLLFEAGGLAKSLDEGSVIPLLIDLEPTELSGPLAQFQCQKLEKDGMWSVVDSLNRKLTAPIQNDRLRKSFEVFWPDLDAGRERLLAEAALRTNSNARADKPDDSNPTDKTLKQIVSRLGALETLLSSRKSEIDLESPVHVTTSGAAGKQEVNVTWFKDLLLVVDQFLSELGGREYQLEVRRSTDTPTYKQVQEEMNLANEVHDFIKQRISKA